MRKGIIAGKFLPPHLGHSYLIRTAQSQCDALTVLICDRPEYGIPASTRKKWLEAMHPDVQFQIIRDTLDDNDSAVWAVNTRKVLGFKPDIVFSSEDYGPLYAKHLGCKHVTVDRNRIILPVSGTRVRANPWQYWEYLHPIVRSYFTKRICIVGAESSGTTTLATALAQHYQTSWVPEYGRAYTIERQDRLARLGWKTADFVRIAQEQNRQEDALAQKANKLLICDTDSFATSIWHERYMGDRSYQVEALAAKRQYDLYLLTDPSIPFVQDGIRDGEHVRLWMHERFQEKLRFWGKPFVVVQGSPNARLKQSTKLINRLFADTAVQLPGLVRDAWHRNTRF